MRSLGLVVDGAGELRSGFKIHGCLVSGSVWSTV